MPLTACSDVSPADWIVAGALPWQRLVGFGPSGFAAYARLRYLPDPAYEGQSENEADVEDDRRDIDQLATLLRALASHTRRPDDSYFCVWEGYGGRGEIYRGERYDDRGDNSSARTWLPARPGLVPELPLSVPQAPKFAVPNRAYFLFHGSLTEVCNWDDVELWAGQTRLCALEPAFVWPTDRAWCVANDVDPHWAGIGADTHVIDQLVADARLDVVAADPDVEQPSYG